jgi:WD40 repeat protein
MLRLQSTLVVLASMSLSGLPPWDIPCGQAGKPRLDHFGDPLPEHALARLGTMRLRQGYYLKAVAFAPDGKSLIAADTDGGIRLWDSATGQLLHAFRAHPGGYMLTTIALSPDGRLLAAYGWRGVITLFELPTGKVRHLLKDDGEYFTCLQFSADSKTLAAARADGKVGTWNVVTGNVVRVFARAKSEVFALHFSADNQILSAWTEGNALHSWNVATGKTLAQRPGDGGQVFRAVFSPDGSRAAVYQGRETFRVLDVASGAEVFDLPGHKNQQTSVGFALAFSADGKKLATLTNAGALRLWDMTTGKLIRLFPPSESYWHAAVAVSPDGATVATTHPFRVRLWDVASGKEQLPSETPDTCVSQLAFSPDGKTLATVSWGEEVARLWDVGSGRQRHTLRGHTWNMQSLAFRPDGKVLATGSRDRSVRLWDPVTAGPLSSERTHTDPVTALAFSADGALLASGSEDRTIRIRAGGTGKTLRVWKEPEVVASSLCFSPDGKTLVSVSNYGHGGERATRLWNVAAGTSELLEEEDGYGGGASVIFSPDGQLFITGGVWDNGSRQLNRYWLRVYETATRQLVWKYEGKDPDEAKFLGALAVTLDGRTLISTHWHSVRFWDLLTGKEIRRLTGHHGPLAALALSRDGRVLATSSHDTTVLLWDLPALLPTGHPPPLQLSRKDLQVCWDGLAERDPAPAYRHLHRLTLAGDHAVAFLEEHLCPVPLLDEAAAVKQLDALADAKFAIRARATAALEAGGELVVPLLKARLKETMVLETHRRLEVLLARLDVGAVAPERLRPQRAVTVLEILGTPAAQKLLQQLAGGAAQARLTQEAQAALHRRSAGKAKTDH